MTYINPSEIVSVDLREIILSSKSVRDIYRTFSINSDDVTKTDLIEEIFRSSTTLSGIDEMQGLVNEVKTFKRGEKEFKKAGTFSPGKASIKNDRKEKQKFSFDEYSSRSQSMIEPENSEEKCRKQFFSSQRLQKLAMEQKSGLLTEQSQIISRGLSFCKSPQGDWRNNLSTLMMLEQKTNKSIDNRKIPSYFSGQDNRELDTIKQNDQEENMEYEWRAHLTRELFEKDQTSRQQISSCKFQGETEIKDGEDWKYDSKNDMQSEQNQYYISSKLEEYANDDGVTGNIQGELEKNEENLNQTFGDDLNKGIASIQQNDGQKKLRILDSCIEQKSMRGEISREIESRSILAQPGQSIGEISTDNVYKFKQSYNDIFFGGNDAVRKPNSIFRQSQTPKPQCNSAYKNNINLSDLKIQIFGKPENEIQCLDMPQKKIKSQNTLEYKLRDENRNEVIFESQEIKTEAVSDMPTWKENQITYSNLLTNNQDLLNSDSMQVIANGSSHLHNNFNKFEEFNEDDNKREKKFKQLKSIPLRKKK